MFYNHSKLNNYPGNSAIDGEYYAFEGNTFYKNNRGNQVLGCVMCLSMKPERMNSFHDRELGNYRW